MAYKIDMRKYSGDKVALLALFGLGLLIANFMVSARHKIHLSEPTYLEFAGLKVSVPTGKGWSNSGKWTYAENVYVLGSRFDVGTQLSAMVQWEYILIPDQLTPQEQLIKAAENIGARVVDQGQIQKGNITIKWIQAKPDVATAVSDIFFAAANLDPGRELKLSIIAPGQEDFAKDIFYAVSESFSFEPNTLFRQGKDFVNLIKETGATNLIDFGEEDNIENIFMLSSSKGSVDGFVVDVFKKLYNNNFSEGIEAESFYFINTQTNWGSENNIFKSNNSFSEFGWQSKQQLSARQRTAAFEVIGEADGVLRVNNIRTGNEKSYRLKGNALINVMSDWALAAFLDYPASDKVILDVILSNGLIVPVMITKLNQSDLTEENAEVSYGVRLDFLHSEKLYQLIYFDSQKRIVKKLENRNGLIVWQRSSREELLEKFDDWQEDIKEMLP